MSEPDAQTNRPARRGHVRDLGPDETLYFLHIHKNAGSSFRAYLHEQFPRSLICPFRWELHHVWDVPPDQWARYRLICGHYGYFLPELVNRPLVCVTMIRDPVDRTLSAFDDQRWREDLWLHDHIKDMTIDDYVFDPIGTSVVMNFQVRSLALDSIQRHYHGYADLWKDPDRLHRVYGDRALLEIAKERLASFAFVGIQDRFEESMRAVAHTFGWPAPAQVPRRNVRRTGGEELDPRTRARIEEITALDRELYDFAVSLFQSRHGGLTDADLDARHRDAMARMPKADELLLRFEHHVPAVGWHAPDKRDAWAGRWTGPGTRASLHLPLRTDRACTVFLRAGAWAPDIADAFTLLANGVALDVHRCAAPDDPRKRIAMAHVPVDVLRASPEFLDLTVVTPRTVRPCDRSPGHHDTRSLGLYVQALEVLPQGHGLTPLSWAQRLADRMAAVHA